MADSGWHQGNGAHWSASARTVKVFGVNAIVTIPLLLLAIKPSSFLPLLMFFLATLTFFVVLENIKKLSPKYLCFAIRYSLMGTSRAPKSRNYDF